MSKKPTIIVISILTLVVIAAGFYIYKKTTQEPPVFDWRTLLVFQVKDQNMSADAIAKYQEMFAGTKARLEKNPDDFAAWLNLGIVRKSIGDYEGAADVWEYAAKIRPQSSQPFSNLGDLYANFLNDVAKGEEYYKKALANDPKDVNIILGLADVYRYRLSGKEYLYEQTILEALKILPNDVNLIAPLALYYRQTNQVEKAIEYYEKLVLLAPDNEMAKEDLEELRKIK